MLSLNNWKLQPKGRPWTPLVYSWSFWLISRGNELRTCCLSIRFPVGVVMGHTSTASSMWLKCYLSIRFLESVAMEQYMIWRISGIISDRKWMKRNLYNIFDCDCNVFCLEEDEDKSIQNILCDTDWNFCTCNVYDIKNIFALSNLQRFVKSSR